MITKVDFFRNNFEAIKNFAENNNPNVMLPGNGTPLGLACFQGKIKTVKCLVQNGADPNFPDKNGWTPLIYAANDCRVNIIRYLLSVGADINRTDSKSRTALHHLCFCHRKDNVEAAKILIDAGIHIYAKDADGKLAIDAAEDNQRFIPNYSEFHKIIAPAKGRLS
jgi:ankyrin repeat protein